MNQTDKVIAFALKHLDKPAKLLMNNKDKVLETVAQGFAKARSNRFALKDQFDNFQSLLRMLKKWARKEYTAVPKESIAKAILAMIYFVNPMDLVPDFILGLGLLDDITLIAWVMSSISTDLDQFRKWEAENES